MSTQNDNAAADATAGNSDEKDIASAIKGEMHRKFTKTSEQIEELASTTRQLTESLNKLLKPQQQTQQSNAAFDPNLLYSNPGKAVEFIKEAAKSEMRQEQDIQRNMDQRTQAAISEIISEYPELNDANTPLSKKMVEIYQKMPEHERSNTAAYKAAARQAAVELEVKPRSKRTAVEDFPDAGSYQSEPRRRNQGKTKLSKEELIWAQLVGVPNLEKPETQARMVERSKRDWSRSAQPLPVKKK